MVKNQGTKQREQRTLEDCWQWKANGQCSTRVTINRHSRIFLRALLRGRMREEHRETEVLQAEAQVEECLYCPARITSQELAPIHSVKNGILQNAFSTSRRAVADSVKSSLMRIASLLNSVAKGQNYSTVGLRLSRYGAAEVFIDFTEEPRHTETNTMCSSHKSRGTSCWHSRPKSLARLYLSR